MIVLLSILQGECLLPTGRLWHCIFRGTRMDPEPLLFPSIPEAVVGAVDYLGRPVSRSNSGGWNAALFVIGVDIAERFAFYGISLNLISYLTGPLCQPTASAAAAFNAWGGTSMMLPLVGAFAADSYLGRYRTILLASLLYVLADTNLVFKHLADQFDQNDPKECTSRSSFFNWWYFAMSGGVIVSVVVLSYIQDNIGWSLGFGIPCIMLLFALTSFLLGTKTYRFYQVEENITFIQFAKTFVSLGRNKKLKTQSSSEEGGVRNTQIEAMLRLFPIWATCLVYGIAVSQGSTWFTKQGSTMDRKIGSSIQVPSAALQCLISGTVVVLMPFYDRIFVPFARWFSKIPSGITMLQRIGTGMFLSLLTMVVGALVEMKRLVVARDSGLVDQHNATIPMSIWWLVPQYVLIGMSELLALVGLQEFLYDQVLDALRSIGLAIFLSIFGVGSFLSSILISIIEQVTIRNGDNWFPNNFNRGHLDYFYWLLAGLSVLSLLMYLYFAQAYEYQKTSGRM